MQVVPHVTDTIMEWIERVAKISVDGRPGSPDVCIIELGGTVGDIESMPYVEALRQFQFRVGRENILFFHVSLVPVLGAVGEEKTKPCQHTVQALRAAGLTPDFLVCRSTQPLSLATKRKLALFCHVPAEHCLGVHDLSNIYRVPLLLHAQGVTANCLQRLGLLEKPNVKMWGEWRSLAELVDSLDLPVTIAVVGKYTNLSDGVCRSASAVPRRALSRGSPVLSAWHASRRLPDCQTATRTTTPTRRAARTLTPPAHARRPTTLGSLASRWQRTSPYPRRCTTLPTRRSASWSCGGSRPSS